MSIAIKEVTQSYTVRANRGRARIWIQGKKLAGAGFTPGRFYALARGANDQELLLLAPGYELNYGGEAELRKVSGKGDLAIIDLSGAGCEPFNTGDPVTITYTNGMIKIERAQA